MNLEQLAQGDKVAKAKQISIIGAGLLGRLSACVLAKFGHQITLIEQGDSSGKHSAAYAAAGLLTPLGEALHSDGNIVAMGFESLKLWPKILASISGFHFFQQQGAIMVSHEQDKSELLRYAGYLDRHYPENLCQRLTRAELLTLEPELGRSFHHGLYLPQEGQIGNRKLLIALEQELRALKVHWLTHSQVTKIDPDGVSPRLSYRRSGQTQQLTSDLIIDCRGTGARLVDSSRQAQPLQDLRGVRGELFQLFAPEVHLTRPIRLMHPRYQLYIAPKPNGHYVVGATEIESEDNAPMTVRSSMELLSAAYSVHPGFAEANIRQHVCQLRPAFSDNQPKIIYQPGLIQINGLYRHGFLLAPVVLQQLLSTVTQTLNNDAMENQQTPYGHWLAITTAKEKSNENIY